MPNKSTMGDKNIRILLIYSSFVDDHNDYITSNLGSAVFSSLHRCFWTHHDLAAIK